MGVNLKQLQVILTAGEATDITPEARRTRFLRSCEGFDPSPPMDGERNTLQSGDGSEMMNYLPLQRCPIEGARGNYDAALDPPAWTGVEDSSAPGYDQDTMSNPDTMSLIVLALAGVEGNIIATVLNGNGQNPVGAFAGYQGAGACVYQEFWGGIPAIQYGAQFLGGYGDA